MTIVLRSCQYGFLWTNQCDSVRSILWWLLVGFALFFSWNGKREGVTQRFGILLFWGGPFVERFANRRFAATLSVNNHLTIYGWNRNICFLVEIITLLQSILKTNRSE